MNQIIENAVQAEARRCSDAIKSAMRARPRPKFDSVSKQLLSQHYEKVKPLGVSFIKFVSVIGRLNGRFGADS